MSRRSKISHTEHECRITEINEEQLIQRAKVGETEALGELFKRYEQAAYRTAYVMLGNDADAKDAVQDGFLNVVKCFGNGQGFRGESTFKTWLCKIVANAALRIRLKRSRQTVLANKFVVFGQTRATQEPSDELIDNDEELRKRIDRFLQQQSAKKQRIFQLRIDKDLDFPDIAQEVEGTTAEKAAKRVRAAFYHLCDKLRDYLIQHE